VGRSCARIACRLNLFFPGAVFLPETHEERAELFSQMTFAIIVISFFWLVAFLLTLWHQEYVAKSRRRLVHDAYISRQRRKSRTKKGE